MSLHSLQNFIRKYKQKSIFFSNPSFFKSFYNAFRVFWEIFTGFLFIARYEKAISFFGSARESLPNNYYREAEELAARMSKKGFVIITGGSGGIMQAANRGAWKVNGDSIGINIHIPHELQKNPFLNKTKRFSFFFTRKTILSCASEIYIFFPGGFGTLDELFEMLVMLQTRHSEPVPILLYSREFWGPLYAYIKESLQHKHKTISDWDSRLVTIVDSVNEAEGLMDALPSLGDRTCRIGSIDA